MKLYSILQSAFTIYLYKGSQTDSKIYQNLIHSIEKNTNKTCIIKPYSFFGRNKFTNDSIIIGHSFGGYFSLLDSLAEKKDANKIKGIILLNSHFNSLGKAWYPRIKQKDIEIPVLTILGAKDNRLPLKISLWDYYEKNQEHFFDKFYIIDKEREHFTGLENNVTESEKLGFIISNFITNVQESNFTQTMKHAKETDKVWKYNFFNILDSTLNFSWSMNIYDGIAKIVMDPRQWYFIHFCLFLLFQPTNESNAQFHDDNSIYFKTRNVCPEQMISEYEKQLSFNMTPQKINLPTIHPSIPVWLSWIPKVTNDSYQVVILPINNNTIYYKFPNPYRILAENK
jgi:hypothetical protein